VKVSVIFSTYNSPRWLQKVLWGFLAQTHTEFEIIIADDGSSDETRALIQSMPTLTHVWQRDDGFRKCRILNKAILRATCDYLVFTDGDCIVRNDFLDVHVKRAAPGYYLSGSYYKLPMTTSEAISRDDIDTGRCFDRRWLRAHGLPASASRLKLSTDPTLARWLNRTTPTACNFKGSNASAWRRDVLTVGGFDERMQWGGLDREIGVRLKNAGIKPRHVRYDAVCLHLDHARGYKDAAKVAANKALRVAVERNGTTYSAHGTDALLSDGYEESK